MSTELCGKLRSSGCRCHSPFLSSTGTLNKRKQLSICSVLNSVCCKNNVMVLECYPGSFVVKTHLSKRCLFLFQMWKEREREMFYLTTHSTHFVYGYMASDIWLRTIPIVRKETRCLFPINSKGSFICTIPQTG